MYCRYGNAVFGIGIDAMCDSEDMAQLVRQDLHGLLLTTCPLRSPPTAPAPSGSLRRDGLRCPLLLLIGFRCKWILYTQINLAKMPA